MQRWSLSTIVSSKTNRRLSKSWLVDFFLRAMKVIDAALDQFKAHHGSRPTEIVITPHAALALGAGDDFNIRSLSGIPVRVETFSADESTEPGLGSRLGLFVHDNGIQQHVAAVELR